MSWGYIGAAAVATVGGAMLSDSGGETTTQSRDTSANPFTAKSSLFTTNWGPGVGRWLDGGNGPNTRGGGGGQVIPPGYVGLSDGRVVAKDSAPAQNGEIVATAGQQFDGSYLGSNAGGGGGSHRSGLNLTINNPQLRQLSEMGLLGANAFFDEAITNENALLAGELGGQFLNQLQTTDPYEIAQNQFDLLNPILQEQHDRDYYNQEQRLFSQGRLGSSEGSWDQKALIDAQRDAERKLLFDSLGQGLAVQSHQASLGATLSQLDPQIRGLFAGLGGQFAQVPLNIQQAMLNQAQVAGGLSGANTVGSLTQPGFNAQNALGAGMVNSGVQGLTNAIPGLFNGTASTYDPGPMDAAYGQGSIWSTPNGAR